MQKVLVAQAQNADCLGVMDQFHTGDPAGKSKTDKQNQRAVGKPSGLRNVPGREDVPDRAVALVDGGGRRCATYFADALGAKLSSYDGFVAKLNGLLTTRTAFLVYGFLLGILIALGALKLR